MNTVFHLASLHHKLLIRSSVLNVTICRLQIVLYDYNIFLCDVEIAGLILTRCTPGVCVVFFRARM